MHIQNSKINPYFSHLNRVEGGQDKDDPEHRKRRRVRYQGRDWSEEDEPIPMYLLPSHEEKEEEKGKPSLLDLWFEKLVTIEDKIAQVSFCALEASYDEEETKQIEDWIYRYEVGGLLFTGGDYKRQSVLIEYFQSLSHIPLLVGNDLYQGLSFYFQEKRLSEQTLETFDAKRLEDVGKAIMSQNRSIGVNFQFSSGRQRSEHPFLISESLLKAFRKGILDAHGIVAEDWREIKEADLSLKKRIYLLGNKADSAMQKPSNKKKPDPTLVLLDLQEDHLNWEKLLHLEKFDGFIISSAFSFSIDRIVRAVRSGDFPLPILDKLVRRMLQLKVGQQYKHKRKTVPTPSIRG